MSALTFDQFEALLRSGRPKHGHAHGARDLNTRDAHPAAGAVDQHGFAATSFGAEVQCVERGAIRHPNASPLGVCNSRRKRMNLVLQCQREFRVCAGQRPRDIHAITRPHALDASANRFDDSRSIGAGGIRQRRLDCISAVTHVGVVRVHADGVDADQDLPGGGTRSWNFFEIQNFGTAEFSNHDSFHCVTSRTFGAYPAHRKTIIAPE